MLPIGTGHTRYWRNGLCISSRTPEKLELVRRQRIIAELLPTLIDQPRVAFDAEVQVARFGFKLLQLVTGGIPRVDTVLTYRSKLSELGFITAHHRVRRKSLMEDFCADIKHYRPALIPHFLAIPMTIDTYPSF